MRRAAGAFGHMLYPFSVIAASYEVTDGKEVDVWQELFTLAYRYLRGRGLSHADAEDLAQETLVIAYLNIDGVDPGSLAAWVRVVARNKHVDLLRRSARVTPVAESPEIIAPLCSDPLACALAKSATEEVSLLLACLSEKQRRLVELQYLEGMSVAEVAAASGSSVNTVKVALHRARKHLRSVIKEGDWSQ